MDHSKAAHWKADLGLLLVTVIWGTTFVVVKEALANVSTLLFLAIRFALATLVLALAFRPLPSKFTGGRTLWAGGLIGGSLLYAAYFLQTEGLLYTTPSKSAFLTGLFVVLVPVLSGLALRRNPHPWEWLGAVVALSGTTCMTVPAGNLKISLGDLLTIGCAVAYAAQMVAVGHYAPKLSFQALTLVQLATVAVLSLGTFWWAEKPRLHWTPGLIVAILATGLLASALAFAVQTWAQQRTSPTRAAVIIATEPLFAWLTSFLVTGETLSLRAILGGVLILAGILCVELKPAAAGEHPQH